MSISAPNNGKNLTCGSSVSNIDIASEYRVTTAIIEYYTNTTPDKLASLNIIRKRKVALELFEKDKELYLSKHTEPITLKTLEAIKEAKQKAEAAKLQEAKQAEQQEENTRRVSNAQEQLAAVQNEIIEYYDVSDFEKANKLLQQDVQKFGVKIGSLRQNLNDVRAKQQEEKEKKHQTKHASKIKKSQLHFTRSPAQEQHTHRKREERQEATLFENIKKLNQKSQEIEKAKEKAKEADIFASRHETTKSHVEKHIKLQRFADSHPLHHACMLPSGANNFLTKNPTLTENTILEKADIPGSQVKLSPLALLFIQPNGQPRKAIKAEALKIVLTQLSNNPVLHNNVLEHSGTIVNKIYEKSKDKQKRVNTIARQLLKANIPPASVFIVLTKAGITHADIISAFVKAGVNKTNIAETLLKTGLTNDKLLAIFNDAGLIILNQENSQTLTEEQENAQKTLASAQKTKDLAKQGLNKQLVSMYHPSHEHHADTTRKDNLQSLRDKTDSADSIQPKYTSLKTARILTKNGIAIPPALEQQLVEMVIQTTVQAFLNTTHYNNQELKETELPKLLNEVKPYISALPHPNVLYQEFPVARLRLNQLNKSNSVPAVHLRRFYEENTFNIFKQYIDDPGQEQAALEAKNTSTVNVDGVTATESITDTPPEQHEQRKGSPTPSHDSGNYSEEEPNHRNERNNTPKMTDDEQNKQQSNLFKKHFLNLDIESSTESIKDEGFTEQASKEEYQKSAKKQSEQIERDANDPTKQVFLVHHASTTGQKAETYKDIATLGGLL